VHHQQLTNTIRLKLNFIVDRRLQTEKSTPRCTKRTTVPRKRAIVLKNRAGCKSDETGERGTANVHSLNKNPRQLNEKRALIQSKHVSTKRNPCTATNLPQFGSWIAQRENSGALRAAYGGSDVNPHTRVVDDPSLHKSRGPEPRGHVTIMMG
jgi:hypothetical protein